MDFARQAASAVSNAARSSTAADVDVSAPPSSDVLQKAKESERTQKRMEAAASEAMQWVVFPATKVIPMGIGSNAIMNGAGIVCSRATRRDDGTGQLARQLGKLYMKALPDSEPKLPAWNGAVLFAERGLGQVTAAGDTGGQPPQLQDMSNVAAEVLSLHSRYGLAKVLALVVPKDESVGLPTIRMVFNAEHSVSIAKVLIHKQVELRSRGVSPLETFYLFINRTSPKESTTLGELYLKYKSEDGYLRITYAPENTLGAGTGVSGAPAGRRRDDREAQAFLHRQRTSELGPKKLA